MRRRRRKPEQDRPDKRMTFAACGRVLWTARPSGDPRTMSGRTVLIVALTALALAGCVGFGESATQNPVVSAPSQTASLAPPTPVGTPPAPPPSPPRPRRRRRHRRRSRPARPSEAFSAGRSARRSRTPTANRPGRRRSPPLIPGSAARGAALMACSASSSRARRRAPAAGLTPRPSMSPDGRTAGKGSPASNRTAAGG